MLFVIDQLKQVYLNITGFSMIITSTVIDSTYFIKLYSHLLLLRWRFAVSGNYIAQSYLSLLLFKF